MTCGDGHTVWIGAGTTTFAPPGGIGTPNLFTVPVDGIREAIYRFTWEGAAAASTLIRVNIESQVGAVDGYPSLIALDDGANATYRFNIPVESANTLNWQVNVILGAPNAGTSASVRMSGFVL
jgi:hypothetical protein